MDLAGGKVKATYLDIHGTFTAPTFRPGQKAEVRPDSPQCWPSSSRRPKVPTSSAWSAPRTVAAHKNQFDQWLKAFKS